MTTKIESGQFATANKFLTLAKAQEILIKIRFGLSVWRVGRKKGCKRLTWTTLTGVRTEKVFSRETPYEDIVWFAESQLPVLDNQPFFQEGDVVEFDWSKKRVVATLVKTSGCLPYEYSFHYGVYQEGYPKRATDHALKFIHKAIVLRSN